jgi:hypothetical protein
MVNFISFNDSFFMVTIDLAKPKMIEYYSGERGGCGPEPI